MGMYVLSPVDGAGGGVTQIVMPYITVGIAKYQPESLAWRYAFLVPACCHVVIAFLILSLAQARMRRSSPVQLPAVCVHLVHMPCCGCCLECNVSEKLGLLSLFLPGVHT